MLTVIKTFCLSEDDNSQRLLKNVERLMLVKGVNFSSMMREALSEYVEKHTRLFQSRIDTFRTPMEEALDEVHREFTTTNAERHSTWLICLQKKGLYNKEAIEYSSKMGWRIGDG